MTAAETNGLEIGVVSTDRVFHHRIRQYTHTQEAATRLRCLRRLPYSHGDYVKFTDYYRITCR